MEKQTTTKNSKPRVILPPLHTIQQTIYDDPHRFKVLVAGRRFGKSILALMVCLDLAINKGKEVWFVSPTYNNVMVHWRNAKRMVGDLPSYKNEQQKYLEFEYNGQRGSVAFKSGDRPDNLLGVGLDFVVVDEAAYQPAELWQRVLRPALADRRGGALLISTPNGVASWFYRAYLMGQDPTQADWASWRFRTVDNPYIDPAEVAQAKVELPDLKFRQEFLAEFVSDAGGVFRNLEAAACLDPYSDPLPEYTYWAGIDWGRRNDYTVVSIYDQNGDQVNIDRFTEIGYNVQRDRIRAINDHWHIHKFVIEANSIGAGQIEALEADGLPIEPVYMTNTLKTMYVERYAANLERNRVRLLSPKHKLGELQLGEMQSYSIYRTRGGLQVTYNAPSGWHDDMVIAGMLGSSHIQTKTTKELEITENPFYRAAPQSALVEDYLLQREMDRLPVELLQPMDDWVNLQVHVYKTIDPSINERVLKNILTRRYIKQHAKSN